VNPRTKRSLADSLADRWSMAVWWYERSCRRSTTPDGGTLSTAGSRGSEARPSGFHRIWGRRNPAASAMRTAPPGTAPQCRIATDPKGSAAKCRFTQALLELHNVLGHPNLPQSLSSTRLHHPLPKLNFVGNQEPFEPETSTTPSHDIKNPMPPGSYASSACILDAV
jgi:hypothetical protein